MSDKGVELGVKLGAKIIMSVKGHYDKARALGEWVRNTRSRDGKRREESNIRSKEKGADTEKTGEGTMVVFKV